MWDEPCITHYYTHCLCTKIFCLYAHSSLMIVQLLLLATLMRGNQSEYLKFHNFIKSCSRHDVVKLYLLLPLFFGPLPMFNLSAIEYKLYCICVCIYQVQTMTKDCHDCTQHFRSAFHQEHLTKTALLRFSNNIMIAPDTGQCTVSVLLDLSSSFDTVDHCILIKA